MDTTTNYGLSKPGYGDSPDIEVLGQNADVIDTELKKAQDHRENSDVHMSADEKDTLNSAVQSATFGGTAVPQDGAKLEIPMPNAGQVGASNPNMLINPCGEVNQRGKSTYSAREYTLDRWYLWPNNSDVVENVFQGSSWMGVTGEHFIRYEIKSISATNYPGIFVQYLEDSDNGMSPLAGKTVTLSMTIHSVNCDYRSLFVVCNDDSNVYHQLASVDVPPNYFGVLSVTGTIPVNSHRVVCGFNQIRQVTSADAGSYIDFTEAKLELGSVATPFSPRSYAEELASCQRYHIDQYLNGAPSYFYRGIYISEASLQVVMPISVSLRISNPTAVLKYGNAQAWNSSTDQWEDLATPYAISVFSGFSVLLYQSLSWMQSETPYIIRQLPSLDCEIY